MSSDTSRKTIFLLRSVTMKLTVNFLCFIFALTIFQEIKSNVCPPDMEEGLFCRCEYRATFICHLVTDSNAIKNVTNLMTDTILLDTFVMRNSNLPRLPDGVFKTLVFEEIKFALTAVNIIEKVVFVESQNVTKSVTFEKVEFSEEFDLEFLEPLRLLRKVAFSESVNLSISDNAFGNLPHLEEIILSEIQFRKIGKLAFASLPRLKRIKLTESGIQKLDANMFNTSQSKHAIYLDLSRNRIQEIDSDAFADMKAHFVDLSSNNLKTLDQIIFEPLLDSMRRYRHPAIHVLENPIDCSSSIKWLLNKPLAFRKLVRGCSCTEQVHCGIPRTPNHGSIVLMTGTSQNHRVIYACNDNFVPFGNEEVECLSDGRWSSPPLECLSICSTFAVEGGFFVRPTVTDNFKQNSIPDGKRFPPGTILSIGCDKAYKIAYGYSASDISSINVSCYQDARWWPLIHCLPVGCDCSDINYDTLSSRNLTLGEECEGQVPHDKEIVLLCNPHTLYFATDYSFSLKCNGTDWEYPQKPDERCTPESPDPCYLIAFQFDNGKTYIDGLQWQYVDYSTNQPFPHGTELKFECEEKGYELYVGNTALSKQLHEVNSTVMLCEHGYWLGHMPVCKPARCSCVILSQYIDEFGLVAKDCDDVVSSSDFVELFCSGISIVNGTKNAECGFGEWNLIYANCID